MSTPIWQILKMHLFFLILFPVKTTAFYKYHFMVYTFKNKQISVVELWMITGMLHDGKG